MPHATPLAELARWLGLDAAELAALNQLDPGASVKAGARLVLPEGTWSDDWRLRLVAPRPGERVRLPVHVAGSAAQGADPLEVALHTRDGRQIALVTLVAPEAAADHHLPFSVDLAGEVDAAIAGYLDLALGAAPDGPALRVPLIIEP